MPTLVDPQLATKLALTLILIQLGGGGCHTAKFLKGDFELLKINRQASGVVHESAKFSFGNCSNGVLVRSVPPCMAYVVMNDCENIII